MQKKSGLIQVSCSVLLLIAGIYLNVYDAGANFKAFVLPGWLEALSFIVLMLWIGVAIYTNKRWVRYSGVASIVAIIWYYLELKVPYEAINRFLNNANQGLMTFLSIVLIIASVGWFTVLMVKSNGSDS